MLSYLRDDNSLKIIRKDHIGNEDKIPTIKNVGTKINHGLLDMTYGDEPLTRMEIKNKQHNFSSEEYHTLCLIKKQGKRVEQ